MVIEQFTNFSLSLIGLLVGYYFYRKSQRVKHLEYHCEAFPLVGSGTETLQHLRMLYRGKDVQSLIAIRVMVVNIGTDVIHRADFASKDPLHLSFGGKAGVLDVFVTSASHVTNGVRCAYQEGQSNLIIEFDYLAPGQGFILLLLHAGSVEDALHLGGTIMGGKGPKRASSSASEDPDRVFEIVQLVLSTVGLGAIVAVISSGARLSSGVMVILGLTLALILAFNTITALRWVRGPSRHWRAFAAFLDRDQIPGAVSEASPR